MNLIPIEILMKVSVSDTTIPMSITSDEITIGLSIGAEYKVAPTEKYIGDYEFIPSDETQTIGINGKVATQDIVIRPIPNNYGLITWNGSTLTVS